MLQILKQSSYRHLFLAQIIALLGTGLATVALGLLAFELAGPQAGSVLGTALAIKMLAYVSLAPIAGALAELLPRRRMLVMLDLIRALSAACLPFVTQVWQVYVLIFILQAASAAFTPTFQATLPDILPDEKDYTQALSLSRLAYDLENLISPMLAAVILSVVSFENLFWGTCLGFMGSALFVVSVLLPPAHITQQQSFAQRLTRGIKIYWGTPRLRALLAVCLSVSAAGAMVLVNTVVLIQGELGLTQAHTAWALSAFGAGSMLAALSLPKVLEQHTDRRVMLLGSFFMWVGIVLSIATRNYFSILALWTLMGLAYSAAQTPSGRLLKRSSHPQDRPAIFAAHFALSHACWLLTYPIAGWLGAKQGLSVTATVLAVLTALGCILAFLIWPRNDAEKRLHSHPGLPPDHPHWQEGEHQNRTQHLHPFVVDPLHSYQNISH